MTLRFSWVVSSWVLLSWGLTGCHQDGLDSRAVGTTAEIEAAASSRPLPGRCPHHPDREPAVFWTGRFSAAVVSKAGDRLYFSTGNCSDVVVFDLNRWRVLDVMSVDGTLNEGRPGQSRYVDSLAADIQLDETQNWLYVFDQRHLRVVKLDVRGGRVLGSRSTGDYPTGDWSVAIPRNPPTASGPFQFLPQPDADRTPPSAIDLARAAPGTRGSAMVR